MHHGGAKQRNGALALALEPSILVNSTSVSWQRICLSLKSYVIVDVDVQVAAWCCWWVMPIMVPPSHAGDGATKVMLAVVSCCYRVMLATALWVMLAMTLPRQLGRGAMSLLNHGGDGAIESCWWWCCRVVLVMVLMSHAGDGATTQHCTSCGKVT
jgi:hypothetical protein